MRDILTHVRTRKVFAAIGEVISQCETKSEAVRFLEYLTQEVSQLANAGEMPLTFVQAVQKFEGEASYGLERIGFWPGSIVK